MMKLKRIQSWLGAVLGSVGFFIGVSGLAAQEKPVPLLVVISVDGLRPDYVTAADEHGAKVPELRKFLREGTYADGVTGVVPTVTYPSHTTLMTGVWPAKHGILANTTFDPLGKNFQGWYWYAEDIRVPTLWSAAAAAGRTTASIQWPVTAGAKITWDIPEYWRAGTPDDMKLLRAIATPGLLEEGKAAIGEYRGGGDLSVEGDQVRGKYAVWILETKHPSLADASFDGAGSRGAPISAVQPAGDCGAGKIGRGDWKRTTGSGANGPGASVCDGGFRSWIYHLRSTTGSVPCIS